MEINNEEELIAIVQQTNENLQAIQNYCGISKNPSAKIIFPRGFLRSASYHRSKMPKGIPALLLHNISYSLMTLDVLRWLIVRTDLSGAAHSMIIKRAISILAEVIETLVKHFSKRKNFGKAVEYLINDEIIDAALGEGLKAVWEARASVHLWEAKVLEHDRFVVDDYNNALVVYEKLISGLVERHGKRVH